MDLLNKLTTKNLKLNKKRTVVTIIGIILSVALITAVSSMYMSSISSLIDFETQQKGNFHVAFYDVPVSEISSFENNRKIQDLYLTKHIGYAELEDSQNEDKPYAHIMSFTQKSMENLSVKLVEGRLPENENEILIPTHLKTNGRIALNVGDTIKLDVGARVYGEYELNQNNPYISNDEDNLEDEHDLNDEDNLVDEDDLNSKDNLGYLNDVSNENLNDNVSKGEEIINTETKTYKIVGIIERPATNIEEYSAPGYTFITYMNDKELEEGKVDVYAKYTKQGVKDSYKVTSNILGVDEDLFEKVNKKQELR